MDDDRSPWASLRVGALIAIAAAGSGCTALGPMPATTAVSPVPANRSSLEGQLGGIPGHYLSSGVTDSPKGSPLGQIALLVEPDSIIGVPGLVVGGRYVGSSENGGYIEPMVGYRTFVDADKRFAVGAVGYGTHGSGSDGSASYSATRAGAEAGVDVRVTPVSKWVEVHVSGGASLTGISASGTYCLDADRKFGIDCPTNPGMTPILVNAEAGGLYPTAVGGLSLEMARHLDSGFHGGRIGLLAAAGSMPRVIGGEQQSAKPYATLGLVVTLAVGERLPAADRVGPTE